MQQLNEIELEQVAGAFPGLGVIVMGPLASACAEAAKQLTTEEQE